MKLGTSRNPEKSCVVWITLMIAWVTVAAAQPLPEHGLQFDTPSTVWDEAIPLGNGLLGGLVWGDGAPLKISLDRTDLWDLRPVPEFHTEDYNFNTMRQWVDEGRIDDLHRLYDQPYRNPGPTKIPAGRIELTIGENPAFEAASLDLAKAMASVKFENGTEAHIYIHAVHPVGLIEVINPPAITPRLIVPAFVSIDAETGERNDIVSGTELAALGYDAPKIEKGDAWTGYEQEGWGGFRFAAALAWRENKGSWRAAWSIATSKDDDHPLEFARRRCEAALDADPNDELRGHLRWWTEFWDQSSIRVPNAVIERQWYLDTYKFGAAARGDTPPITLQGPWTADNGRIPPWKGDYHHDLNTELSYWPCYSGNRLEDGLGYLRWLWKTRATARTWTKRFFDLPGLNIPMTADLNNDQIGGWHQYTHSATTAAWLAHHFYLHWRYSMDRDFLRDRAYPFLHETSIFLDAVLEEGEDGKRRLPLSSSPEINDNRLEAWFVSSLTNYDLALIRWNFEKTAELADEVGEADEAKRWRGALATLPGFALSSEDRRLLVAPDYPLKQSHRHFSHLMAIHPLGLIQWENGGEDRQTIRAALAELDRLGSSQWTGYSFAWLASLAARGRDGETAARALEIFSTAFCLRNSFHCNGDQSGKGYSNFTYRPFTLEGNFAAAAGLQEMLLQSYSGTIRVFPAIPDDWRDASFKNLRAEGAFLISAQRRGGLVQRVEIVAEAGGTCRFENPGGTMRIEGAAAPAAGGEDDELRFDMKPGQRIVWTRE